MVFSLKFEKHFFGSLFSKEESHSIKTFEKVKRVRKNFSFWSQTSQAKFSWFSQLRGFSWLSQLRGFSWFSQLSGFSWFSQLREIFMVFSLKVKKRLFSTCLSKEKYESVKTFEKVTHAKKHFNF